MHPGNWLAAIALAVATTPAPAQSPQGASYFPVAAGAHPHDVAAAAQAGGPVYYTEQAVGKLGVLDPASGRSVEIALGERSAPHGVIVGPDRAAWITDGGRNAIVRVDADTHAIARWPLPASASDANLNTLTFDRRGRLWFTGQAGYYGRLDPASGHIDVWRAPGGAGPYGMTITPSGDIYYASRAGSHIGRIDVETGKVSVIAPPTPNTPESIPTRRPTTTAAIAIHRLMFTPRRRRRIVPEAYRKSRNRGTRNQRPLRLPDYAIPQSKPDPSRADCQDRNHGHDRPQQNALQQRARPDLLQCGEGDARADQE